MNIQRRKGIRTVVSGFSGSGKGTVMKLLLSKHEEYALSISATTRSPRPGEEHGREYFFHTREEFKSFIENDQLLEYAEYVGNFYGTPLPYVKSQLKEGRDVILEIEMQGALKVKRRIPDAVLVFITPPSMEELERRLIGRNTETMEVIKGRLAQAIAEARAMHDYDYILVNENDRAEECAERLHGIIQSEHFRAFRSASLIDKMTRATTKGES